MTVQEAYELLKKTGIQTVYGGYEQKCTLPCVTLNATSSSYSGSDDGCCLVETLKLEVNLYTKNKDVNTEYRILEIFSSENEIERTERYIFEEKVYENCFTISTTNKLYKEWFYVFN